MSGEEKSQYIIERRSIISLGLSFFIYKTRVLTGKPNAIIFYYLEHSNKEIIQKAEKITSPNAVRFIDQT